MALTFTHVSTVSVTNPVSVPGAPAPVLFEPSNIRHDADGNFVGVAAPGPSVSCPTQIHVVLNWQEELKQRVPTR